MGDFLNKLWSVSSVTYCTHSQASYCAGPVKFPHYASYIQAHLRDIVGLVLDHYNKANIAKREVTQIWGFPSTCKSYIYTTLHSISMQ